MSDNGDEWVSVYLTFHSESEVEEVNGVQIGFIIIDEDRSPLLSMPSTLTSNWKAGDCKGFPKFVLKSELMNPGKGYIKDSTLRMRVFVSIFKRVDQESHQEIAVPKGQLGQDLGQIFGVEEVSDIQVKCGSKTFHCLKAILGARSQVFNVMFNSDMVEAKTGQVEVTDVSEKGMEKVLKFMYTDKYEYEEELVAEVLAGAEKYGLARLKAMCVKNLMESVSEENAIDILVLSKQFSIVSLKDKVIDFLKTCDSEDIQL